MKKKSIVIIAIIALACIAAIIAAIWKNAPAQKQAKQLELGNRYLEEMEYEQAKVVFEELITIDPSNVGAYLGAAKAYAGLEDYEGAVAILQKGYDQTGSEEIKAQMEEYEQKLEEQKAEAEQALESEIYEYMDTLPYYHLEYLENDNPIYTYSYLKKVYDEKLPKLFEYMEMDISDATRSIILDKIHECYLSINDIEKAKEYWTQSVALSKEGDFTSMEEYDEYGRIIRQSGSVATSAYEYYENSSLVKVEITTYSCYTHDGYSDVDRTEFEEYDDEGRVLREVVHESCGYDVANASSLPTDFPIEGRGLLEYTYTYESNSRKTLCQTVSATEFSGETHFSTGGSKNTETYDEVGNRILDEYYDLEDNLTSRTEYDTMGRTISCENYDEDGNLTSRIEYDTEGNVISDTSY